MYYYKLVDHKTAKIVDWIFDALQKMYQLQGGAKVMS